MGQGTVCSSMEAALVVTQYTFACVVVQWCWRQRTPHSALWEEEGV